MPPQIGLAQHAVEVFHLAVIADGHQNAPRPCVDAGCGYFGLDLQIEMLQTFLLILLAP